MDSKKLIEEGYKNVKESVENVTSKMVKNTYYSAVGKRIVMPAWVWSYVSSKSYFMHMSDSAWILMLIQLEMQQNNKEIKSFMESSYFQKLKNDYKGGLPEVVNPFDGEFIQMVMRIQQAKEIKDVMAEGSSNTYFIENPASKRIELVIGYGDEKFATRMGFLKLLSEKGWRYMPSHRCWFSPKSRNLRGIKSEDIALVTGIVDAIDNRNNYIDRSKKEYDHKRKDERWEKRKEVEKRFSEADGSDEEDM